MRPSIEVHLDVRVYGIAEELADQGLGASGAQAGFLVRAAEAQGDTVFGHPDVMQGLAAGAERRRGKGKGDPGEGREMGGEA